MHLPFLPAVILLSKLDSERGKFAQAGGTNERKTFLKYLLASLGQWWVQGTTSKCDGHLKPGLLLLPAVQTQVSPVPETTPRCPTPNDSWAALA